MSLRIAHSGWEGRRVGVPNRHSTASAPCPTGGKQHRWIQRSTSRGRGLDGRERRRPSRWQRTRPAHPTCPAGCRYCPERPTKVRSGRRWPSCARRRIDPVATVAPRGRSSSRQPPRASRGSARSGMAIRVRPSGVSAGKSLAKWPGYVGSTVEHRVLDLLDEHPLTTHLFQGGFRSRSPVVSTITISTVQSGRAAVTRAARRSACQRARALPRVAARMCTPTATDRRGRAGPQPGAPHGRYPPSPSCEQSARAGVCRRCPHPKGLDGFALAVVQVTQPGGQTIQLAPPDVSPRPRRLATRGATNLAVDSSTYRSKFGSTMACTAVTSRRRSRIPASAKARRSSISKRVRPSISRRPDPRPGAPLCPRPSTRVPDAHRPPRPGRHARE
ncbi:MAG: hypothetical protein CM1200mP26_28550 [Acidimicrobiales bacterium]|nr:MAG: hypothetical protein CM1200mP26_28550 [Acidimicrobiales bacterium]